MSLQLTFDILKELGGQASSAAIKERAKDKYPKLTLHGIIGRRLRKLQRDRYIDYKDGLWVILRRYP